MRRSLTPALLALVLLPPALHGQVLDHTMVPAGRVRLQAHGVFESWDSRFGRGPDGTARIEPLGGDLTDPATLSLFPGIASLTSSLRDVVGGFDPVLGSTSALVRQDVTRIEWGAHLGVTDWLTVGVVAPWVRTRSAIDIAFQPDTVRANVGLNPVMGSPAQVDVFLSSTASARQAAQAYAASECAGGASAACATAQSLADRTATFDGALRTAYGASPFFPLLGTAAGDALTQSATALSADLTAAGLGGLAPLVLSGEPLTEEGDLALVPSLAGAGIESAAPRTRQSLWSFGDIEVSARLRLLDNLTPAGEEWTHPGFGYRLTGRFLVRLPTGTRVDPDIPFDLGTGEAQTDLQGGLTATLAFGRHFGLTGGGYYGSQGATTITTRVVPRETVFAPASTRTQVRWKPGFYVGAAVAPSFHLAPSITLAGEYRYFHKGRDRFELIDAASLNTAVLEIESGIKAHQVGGGLRYRTVDAWRRGEASMPMEIHVRLLTTFHGSGGQVPKATRLEAGLRLFRRLWGPSP